MTLVNYFSNAISISIVSLIVGCSEGQSRKSIYLPGREWVWEVSNIDTLNKIEELSLKVIDGTWQVTQTKIEWLHKVNNSAGYQIITEQTGVIDRSESIFYKNRIWIHPPRNGIFKFAEIVPFPEVNLPPVIGDEIESNMKPEAGWEELQGIEMKGKLKMIQKEYYPKLFDSCWVIMASGNSKIGNLNARFRFSEKYGFVSFEYFLPRDTVKAFVTKVNF